MKRSIYVFAVLIISLFLLQNELMTQPKEGNKSKSCCSTTKVKTAESSTNNSSKQKLENNSALNKHACNTNCSQEKHSFQHGEIGHLCDDKCKIEPANKKESETKEKSDLKK